MRTGMARPAPAKQMQPTQIQMVMACWTALKMRRNGRVDLGETDPESETQMRMASTMTLSGRPATQMRQMSMEMAYSRSRGHQWQRPTRPGQTRPSRGYGWRRPQRLARSEWLVQSNLAFDGDGADGLKDRNHGGIGSPTETSPLPRTDGDGLQTGSKMPIRMESTRPRQT